MKLYNFTLAAMVMFDGHLGKASNTGNSQLMIEHQKPHLEYLRWKAELLATVLDCKIPNISTRKNRDMCYFTKRHPIFTMNRKHWVKSNVHIYNFFTRLELAIWFMDDGYCKFRRRANGTLRDTRLELALHEDEEIAQQICDIINTKFEVEFKISKGSGKGYILIMTHRHKIKKFLSIVEPIVRDIECMHYKIDTNAPIVITTL